MMLFGISAGLKAGMDMLFCVSPHAQSDVVTESFINLSAVIISKYDDEEPDRRSAYPCKRWALLHA